MLQEKEVRAVSGWAMVFTLLAVLLVLTWALVQAAQVEAPLEIVFCALGIALDSLLFAGLTVVNPNEARVLTLFGVYKGSIKQPGFWWVNPLTQRKRLSLRIRNFESGRLKVNDRDGNPIEIAAVVVWRIVETFEAVFNVNDYENFVHVQSVLRHEATGADFLVMHLRPWSTPPGQNVPWPDVAGCLPAIEQALGAPVYRDDAIVVFALKR